MGITSINGVSVYNVTSAEVKCKPSHFQTMAKTWIEGEKKDHLSDEEIEALKKKYNTNNISSEDSVELLGDLVKSGIISIDTARKIHCGFIPLDTKNIDPANPQGYLTKSTSRSMAGGLESLGSMIHARGIDYYRSWLETAKLMTDVDVNSSSYFQDCESYLKILEQLRA